MGSTLRKKIGFWILGRTLFLFLDIDGIVVNDMPAQYLVHWFGSFPSPDIRAPTSRVRCGVREASLGVRIHQIATRLGVTDPKFPTCESEPTIDDTGV